ncbi:MAG: GAF domain-containing protein [Candidatus Omnitrophica bacterium]|nr:GAF domain-containing protein [Candidatus Omnitrophota bacterium]MCA9427016.1 GAF domain-containing protein [Candidatus Omnitrophota bacterium]
MERIFLDVDVPEALVQSWQETANMLAELVGVPAALIMRLNKEEIEVFISSKTEGNPYHPGDKEFFDGSGLYCETVIKSKGRLHVPDALADEDWKDNPDVKLSMISYLGYPLYFPNGAPFGTICVLDKKRNDFDNTIDQLIEKLKFIIEVNLEQLFLSQLMGREIQSLGGIVPICAKCKSIRDTDNKWYPIETFLIEHDSADFSHGLCPRCLQEHYPEYDED